MIVQHIPIVWHEDEELGAGVGEREVTGVGTGVTSATGVGAGITGAAVLIGSIDATGASVGLTTGDDDGDLVGAFVDGILSTTSTKPLQ